MSRAISLTELSILLQAEKHVKPRINDVARRCLGRMVEVLDTIGLPEQVGDSFKSATELAPCLQANGCIYNVGGKEIVIHRAVEIGRNEFGYHVVDCDTGYVVYVDSSGVTQLINTSLERFLYFVGRFLQSAKNKFEDADSLLMDCKQADAEPLANPEGMWSVIIEEAAAGLY